MLRFTVHIFSPQSVSRNWFLCLQSSSLRHFGEHVLPIWRLCVSAIRFQLHTSNSHQCVCYCIQIALNTGQKWLRHSRLKRLCSMTLIWVSDIRKTRVNECIFILESDWFQEYKQRLQRTKRVGKKQTKMTDYIQEYIADSLHQSHIIEKTSNKIWIVWLIHVL